jgi:hypothetical protein
MNSGTVERLADINVKFTEVVAYNGISTISSIEDDRKIYPEDHNYTQ